MSAPVFLLLYSTVSYCHLCFLCLYCIYPHNPVNGANFEKNSDTCFDFLYNFCLKHFSFEEEFSQTIS
jgi:hypothetical protein